MPKPIRNLAFYAAAVKQAPMLRFMLQLAKNVFQLWVRAI